MADLTVSATIDSFMGAADAAAARAAIGAGTVGLTFNEPASDLSAGTQSIFDTGTVGESVAFGDLLYLKSDGKWWMADADAASYMPALRVALDNISTNGTCPMLAMGRVRNDTWNWTPGGILYASTSGGLMTQTPPSGTADIVQIVGIALSATVILFAPEADTLEIQ